MRSPRVLLVGPYDPHCGEYTFLAPPLGRVAPRGRARRRGRTRQVFDPNCCTASPRSGAGAPEPGRAWDVIGISTTGMTLRFDLELAHPRAASGARALLVAGGMEATFRPELMFELAPFDLVVLGEGERRCPSSSTRLRCRRSRRGDRRNRRAQSGWPRPAGCRSGHSTATALRDAIFSTPYEKMPYRATGSVSRAAYRVGALPTKAEREARLAEIRSVRLITLNYCPMGCTFCSATNFLHEAQGSVATIARLDADECVQMLERIVAAHRACARSFSRTTSSSSPRTGASCRCAMPSLPPRRAGRMPRELQFISTNRIDAMTASGSPPCAAPASACSASASRASRRRCSPSSTRRRSSRTSSRC